jgi:hypothetical protein
MDLASPVIRPDFGERGAIPRRRPCLPGLAFDESEIRAVAVLHQ